MLCVFLLALSQSDPVTPSDKEILAWIEMLSSDVVEKRNEAFRKLDEAGDAAVPLLRKTLDGGDPELQGRCRELITRNELQPGAAKLARIGIDVPDMRCEPDRKKEFGALAAAGKIDELLKRDYDWLPYAFDGLLSDEKPVVRGSIHFIHGVIRKRSIPGVSISALAKDKPDIRQFRSAEVRADEYTYWAQWWFTKTARNLVAAWEKGPTAETENWGEALRLLGGGWKEGEEKRRFEKIRSYGKSAYPHLLGFIHAGDLPLANAAVTLLRRLTGRKGNEAVTEENVLAVRAEWKAWMDSQK